jgi:1-acyl-sn-glycerol-3-phosphate acyltransferase
MCAISSGREKPISEVFRPHLTRLPRITWWRRLIRLFSSWLARLLIWLFLRIEFTGLQNIPPSGPALIVSNHLGDVDFLVLLAFSPRQVEAVGKIELFDLPVLGKFLDLYGIIWVHRGHADRQAIKAVLEAFKDKRLVAIAPEGRESLTGSLEKGTSGAAYLAHKGNVPVIPATITGTENSRIFSNLNRFRKTDATLKIGSPFLLDNYRDWRMTVREGTEQIMRTLAMQLPPEYQGDYRESVKEINERENF